MSTVAATSTALTASTAPTARIRFTDTVGFIRKLPHDLVASFRSTLEEAGDADVLLHVVDVSHPAWREQVAVVGETLAGAGLEKQPVVLALNKADRLEAPERAQHLAEAEAMGFPSVLVSAVRREGLEALGGEIAKLLGG